MSLARCTRTARSNLTRTARQAIPLGYSTKIRNISTDREGSSSTPFTTPARREPSISTRATRVTRVTRASSRVCTSTTIPRSLHTSSTHFKSSPRPTSDPDPTSLEAIKRRAWYLDTPPHLDPHSSSCPSSSSSQAPRTPARPKFTTFDPDRTLPQPSPSAPLPPLPLNAPDYIQPLHAFLGESELLDRGSVVFLHAPSAAFSRGGQERERERERERGRAGGGEERGEEELSSGAQPTWEWVVCATVKGRGKGVVGRAERELRVWVSDGSVGLVHPLSARCDVRCAMCDVQCARCQVPGAMCSALQCVQIKALVGAWQS